MSPVGHILPLLQSVHVVSSLTFKCRNHKISQCEFSCTTFTYRLCKTKGTWSAHWPFFWLLKADPLAAKKASAQMPCLLWKWEIWLWAIGMFKSGTSFFVTAWHFGVSRPIRMWLWRYQATGTVFDFPHTGRPRVMTRQQNCYITLTHLWNRFQTAAVNASTPLGWEWVGSVLEPSVTVLVNKNCM